MTMEQDTDNDHNHKKEIEMETTATGDVAIVVDANQVTDDGHVHVEVVKQFETLREDLARESLDLRRTQQQKEEAGDEQFDLREYFENTTKTAREQQGIKPKRMGVTIRNLTVVGEGADVAVIPDLLSPIRGLLSMFNPRNWFNKNHGTTFDILHEVNGFCKPGEMLLVLGRPGAGCSSLLRIIGNQRKAFVEVRGDVRYGGVLAHDFKRYKGEALYTPEEDLHFPTLTLNQTLDFALKTKTPGNRLPEDSKRTFRARVFNLLVTMFGLTKQVDTLVGNEFVRGLSGGERKRLTIAEAMVSESTINCWDCSTRGLDAASALDYAKGLRVMSDTLHKTTIASFYQASEAIYDLFDRVLVLEKGRCIYFGSTKDAKSYFTSMGFVCEPRKSTPDFLTGITNSQERKIQPGAEDRVPQTSVEFETAWKQSTQFQNSLNEQTEYEKLVEQEKPFDAFKEEVKNAKGKGTRKKSVYTVNFFQQARALTVRQAQLIWGDKFSICTNYFSVICQALLYASVFYKMPLTATGGFQRGGALFCSLLFNAFLSQAEMPNSFYGRGIIQKQKSYAMYHPSAYHLSQVICDIPMTLLQVAIFSIITYFMYGLDLRADKFFVYMFTLFISAMCITNLFRAFGNLTPSLFIAQQFMGAILILFLCYCGYFIPYNKMHPWLQWVFWINPFSYAFKALFSNEMRDMVFQCQGEAIPYGASYTQDLYRACALPGAEPGTLTVTGEAYLYTAYGFKVSEMSLNVTVVFLWWVLYTLINCFGVEFLSFVTGGFTKKVYKRGKAPKLNDENFEREQAKIVQEATNNMGTSLEMHGGNFTWQDVRYTVPVKEGTRLLLDNVEGWIKPGQMTALMGSSGAGKTTLLDVLAKRKTVGVIEGKILLNGMPLRVDFERITGYVEQMDVHNPGLTVREALRFSAKLRQNPETPLEDKYAYVERVLEMMEMKHLGDALVGSLEAGLGISVEERKRLTIGMELVAKPHILFLDEPTSGLDAQSSYNIIKFIRKLADAGMPLVCTIHQPSSVLFEYFDRLLLLARGGKTVYFGDIGPKSRVLLDYFERHGVRKCSDQENPAEYILEAIGAGVNGKTDQDWPALWKSSSECAAVNKELQNLEGLHESKFDSNEQPREFATTQWYQFVEVFKRMNVVWWRDPAYNFGRIFQALVVGLINGFSYWQLKNSTSDMQSRIMCIFQTIVLGLMLIFMALGQFFMQREYFRRDYASKFYSWIPFSLSIILTELPYLTLCATICVVVSYWTAGLDSTAGNGFYFWIVFVLFMWFCVSFGQAVAAISANIFIAMIILPLLQTFLFLFAGVLSPPNALPTFWRSWMYPLDPFHYFLEGIVTNVLQDVQVTCTGTDLIRFMPPPGQTCGEYTRDFFASGARGYIDNPDATDMCDYCQYSNGADFFEPLEWSYDNRWRNFGILAAYWIFNIMCCAVFVYWMRKPRR